MLHVLGYSQQPTTSAYSCADGESTPHGKYVSHIAMMPRDIFQHYPGGSARGTQARLGYKLLPQGCALPGSSAICLVTNTSPGQYLRALLCFRWEKGTKQTLGGKF